MVMVNIRKLLPLSHYRFGFPFDSCEHYKRRCKFRIPCCDKIFLCRHCHNTATLIAPSDATINGSCSSCQGLRAMCPVNRYDCQRALHNLRWCYCWAIYCWGTLRSINQLFICIGILAAVVAGLPLAGNPLWWRTMFGIVIIPSVLLALGMAFSPESPTWLYQQGKFSEPEMAIKRLFEKERVAEVMNDFSPATQGSS